MTFVVPLCNDAQFKIMFITMLELVKRKSKRELTESVDSAINMIPVVFKMNKVANYRYYK